MISASAQSMTICRVSRLCARFRGTHVCFKTSHMMYPPVIKDITGGNGKSSFIAISIGDVQFPRLRDARRIPSFESWNPSKRTMTDHKRVGIRSSVPGAPPLKGFVDANHVRMIQSFQHPYLAPADWQVCAGCALFYPTWVESISTTRQVGL